MADLYRVFPFLSDAGPNQPGGGLYIPLQGGGRLDNADLYSVFYASDTEAGAVAEAFGRFPEWTPAILEGSPSLPGSSRAIAHYRLDEAAPICDLNDPAQLVALELRPSEIVSRNYARTRKWAAGIYRQRRWIGVRWWSYYDPRWSSLGLWEVNRLTLLGVRTLRLDDGAVSEAAHVICRRISGR